jgi:hypothetical protein
MQLQFDHVQHIASGHNPAAWHSPDQIVQVYYTDAGGRIWAADAETPFGNFADREFSLPHLAAPDEGAQSLSVSYLPRMNFWAVWRVGDIHRLGVFLLKQETNKYLVDGSLSFRADDPGVSLSLTLENPAGIISTEEATETPPGTRISVFFRAGDSGRYPLGIYYLDRISTKTGDPLVQLSARNATGKLLKDQTFDEDRTFDGRTDAILAEILDAASVINYRIEPNTDQITAEFPPNMSYFDGIMAILSTIPDWQMREDVSGTIVIGSSSFVFSPGNYTFSRGHDCFSREVVRDDRETYSRVCVHDREFTVMAFRDVTFPEGWNLPRRKTLYVEAPEGTTQAKANTLATHLATRLAGVGTMETFNSPFRPHLQPGDQATITEGNKSTVLGVITAVGLQFGRQGFYTEFTVDSGGVVKKPMIRDLIEQISGRRDVGSAKIE